MLGNLAIAMMGSDRFILINALEEDARLHNAAMTVGFSPDFANIDELHEILKCTKSYIMGFDECTSFKKEERPKQNNDWRKSNKRGFNGYWSAK